jgi:hypothetical protein
MQMFRQRIKRKKNTKGKEFKVLLVPICQFFIADGNYTPNTSSERLAVLTQHHFVTVRTDSVKKGVAHMAHLYDLEKVALNQIQGFNQQRLSSLFCAALLETI